MTEIRKEGSADAALEGVCFPEIEGARPTTQTNRGIFGDAAAAVDSGLGERIAAAEKWRSEYVGFLRELTVRAGTDRESAIGIADAGLRSMRRRMVHVRMGEELSLDEGLGLPPVREVGREEIVGGGEPAAELVVPYQGAELHGDSLVGRLEAWVEDGIVEPSFADAIGRVIENPGWLSLPGRVVAMIGAGAELGPLRPLTSWGADVLVIDIPDQRVWERIAEIAGRGAGKVTLPLDSSGARGLDLVRELPEARHWLETAAGERELVLGMYAYADGGAHIRVTAAFDTLATGVLASRPTTALAWLATPTDTFVVPEEVVAAAREAWDSRGVRRLLQAPLRAGSLGRLFAPAYGDGEPVADAVIPQQGPNYALAKRLQRWRGVRGHAEGERVSFNVAPATWTRSVTKNRILAAAYGGAHHFGVEVFSPDTCRVLMAALLVHDLNHPVSRDRHPETLFSDGAAHGGLWRRAYDPRSALGLAALAGVRSALAGDR